MNIPIVRSLRAQLGRATAVAALLALAPLGVIAAQAAGPVAPALVTPAWLVAHLHTPNLVVVEVYDFDKQKPAYEKEHIPGAVFTGFLSDHWRVPMNGLPFVLPPEATIAKVIAGVGINDDSRVILVPAGAIKGDFPATTRVYWTLRIEGMNNVSIMNGGDHAWLANPKDPVATGDVTPAVASFTPHFDASLLATQAMVQADLNTHRFQLVDARPVKQYEGKVRPAVDRKVGTIPGALNLPYSVVLTSDGEGMLDRAEVVAAMHKAGISTDKPAYTFCNTGHLASLDWFALREVAHVPDVKLYSGSMSEWTRDASLPVVNGKSAF
ncbi:MAG: rhodanese-like domain-containing protein [Acidiphilium sp.]|nr:rhodanese-like domain-containing protein [Acidiphilium sp.]MDD4935088.1 rhodanese-like domain-containing protein [Acidiphilium sp.]